MPDRTASRTADQLGPGHVVFNPAGHPGPQSLANTTADHIGPGMPPGASYAHIVSGGSVRRNTATATTAQKTTVTGGGSTAHARWMDVRETTDHDRRLDPGAIVVLRIAYIHSHTPPHRLAHTAEIRTAVGGVLVRSCSGADLRLPGIPRRIRGGLI